MATARVCISSWSEKQEARIKPGTGDASIAYSFVFVVVFFFAAEAVVFLAVLARVGVFLAALRVPVVRVARRVDFALVAGFFRPSCAVSPSPADRRRVARRGAAPF